MYLLMDFAFNFRCETLKSGHSANWEGYGG